MNAVVSTTPSTARHASSAALLAAILIGGACGALSRAGVQRWWPADGGWPWGTFAANLAGTAVLAVLAAVLTAANDPTRIRRGLLGTGFCGALTTFSAFQVETIDLAKDGRPGLAVAYAAASLVAGLGLAIGIGALVRRVRFG